MANTFRGIPFENNGENLCYCNSGSNALLSSEKLTSQIRPHDDCLACEFLFRMKDVTPHPPAKSARPPKTFVAQIDTNINGNEQQDVGEFINHVLTNCEKL